MSRGAGAFVVHGPPCPVPRLRRRDVRTSPAPFARTRTALGLLFALSTTSAVGCLAHHDAIPADAPADARWIALRGVKTRFVDDPPHAEAGPAAEKATPALLLHGFAASLDTWTGVRAALRSQRRVLALDFKGFGYSARPAGDYSPDEQARLALALLDARGVAKVQLVGHSWGSAVALALARLAPERVERIALYDAWVFEAQLPPFFLWARAPGVGEALFALIYQQRAEDRLQLAFYAPERVPQQLVDHALAGIERPGTTAAHLAAVRGQRLGDAEPGYARIAAPVLLLWGREDRVTPLRYGERLLRLLPTGKLRVYPRCGHFPMLEATAESTRDLLAFLGEERA